MGWVRQARGPGGRRIPGPVMMSESDRYTQVYSTRFLSSILAWYLIQPYIKNQTITSIIMLTRAQVRYNLRAILTLSIVATVLSVTAAVYAGINKHNGFFNDNTAITCSSGTYYQFKYSTDLYLKVFAVGLGVSAISCIVLMILALANVCHLPSASSQDKEEYQFLTLGKINGTFIVCTFALLAHTVVSGYCLSLFFDVRNGICSDNYNPDWIIIGSLSLTALICTFVCLIVTLRLVHLWKQKEDTDPQKRQLLNEELGQESLVNRQAGSTRQQSNGLRNSHSKVGVNVSNQSESARAHLLTQSATAEAQAPLLQQSGSIYENQRDSRKLNLSQSPSFANQSQFKTAVENDPQREKPINQAGRSVTNINIHFPNGHDQTPMITTHHKQVPSSRENKKIQDNKRKRSPKNQNEKISQSKFTKRKASSSDEERVRRYRYEQSDESDARYYKRSPKNRGSYEQRHQKYKDNHQRYETRRREREGEGYEIVHPYQRHYPPHYERERAMIVPRSTHDLRQYRVPEEQYYRAEQPYYPRNIRHSPSEQVGYFNQRDDLRRSRQRKHGSSSDKKRNAGINKSRLSFSPQANLQVSLKSEHSPPDYRQSRVRNFKPPEMPFKVSSPDQPLKRSIFQDLDEDRKNKDLGSKYDEFFESQPTIPPAPKARKSKKNQNQWQNNINTYFQGLNSNPSKDYVSANNYSSVLSEAKQGKIPEQRQASKTNKVNLDANRVSPLPSARGAIRAEDMIQRIRGKYTK